MFNTDIEGLQIPEPENQTKFKIHKQEVSGAIGASQGQDFEMNIHDECQ